MEEPITVSGKDCIVVDNFPFEKKNKKPLDVPSPEAGLNQTDYKEIDYCIDENGNGISSEEVEEEIFNNEDFDSEYDYETEKYDSEF